eukprot:SAG31_NODE_227_length_19818_cov_6.503271_12_plen_85_part_00
MAGEDLDARLKSLGIKTNTVAGQKTGVSLARHRELATAIHAALVLIASMLSIVLVSLGVVQLSPCFQSPNSNNESGGRSVANEV